MPHPSSHKFEWSTSPLLFFSWYYHHQEMISGWGVSVLYYNGVLAIKFYVYQTSIQPLIDSILAPPLIIPRHMIFNVCMGSTRLRVVIQLLKSSIRLGATIVPPIFSRLFLIMLKSPPKIYG